MSRTSCVALALLGSLALTACPPTNQQSGGAPPVPLPVPTTPAPAPAPAAAPAPAPPAPAPAAPTPAPAPPATGTRPLRPELGLSLSDVSLASNPLDIGSSSVGVAERAPKVAGIVGGSPAALAGIKVGDRIFRVDDRKIDSAADFEAALRDRTAPGSITVVYGVTRHEAHEVKLVVAAPGETVPPPASPPPPAPPPPAPAPAPPAPPPPAPEPAPAPPATAPPATAPPAAEAAKRPLRPELGISLSDPSDFAPIDFGGSSIGVAEKAPKIAGLVGGSPAGLAGLKAGDKIFAVDGRSVESVAAFEAALRDKTAPGQITVKTGPTRVESRTVTITVK